MRDSLELSRRAFLRATGGLVVAGGVGASVVLCRHDDELYAKRFLALGTRLTILVSQAEHRVARDAVGRAMREIFAVHELATLFEPSPLTDCNAQAYAKPMTLPAPLFELVRRSDEMAVRTHGLFDITVGALVSNFRAPSSTASQVALGEIGEGVGRSHLAIDLGAATVRLGHPKTALDLNGIAKGFAVERAAQAMRAAGVSDFLINAGGEIYAAGVGPEREDGWRVRVEAQDPHAPPVLEVVLKNQTIATSGNGRQPLGADGAHQVHLFDPRRKQGCDALASASVVTANPTEADAWSTAVFVAGDEMARAVLAHKGGVQAYLVTKDGRVTNTG